MGGPVLNAGPSLIVGIIVYIGVLEYRCIRTVWMG